MNPKTRVQISTSVSDETRRQYLELQEIMSATGAEVLARALDRLHAAVVEPTTPATRALTRMEIMTGPARAGRQASRRETRGTGGEQRSK